MGPRTVADEHQARVAEYAALLPELGTLQQYGQHALVAAALAGLAQCLPPHVRRPP